MPWRRTGVKYTNNEAYFDVVEEVDAIIDKAGSTVFAEIQGYVRTILKLSCILFKFSSILVIKLILQSARQNLYHIGSMLYLVCMIDTNCHMYE